VKRGDLFHDTYRQLNHLSVKELRGKLRIEYHGE
jgi:hypothetical protein